MFVDINSNYGILYVENKPFLSTIPISESENVGDTIKYILSPVGTGHFSYQWMKNNINITQGRLIMNS